MLISLVGSSLQCVPLKPQICDQYAYRDDCNDRLQGQDDEEDPSAGPDHHALIKIDYPALASTPTLPLRGLLTVTHGLLQMQRLGERTASSPIVSTLGLDRIRHAVSLRLSPRPNDGFSYIFRHGTAS